MDDHFYNPIGDEPNPPAGLVSKLWGAILSAPPAILVTILLAPVLLIVASRLLSEKPSQSDGNKTTTGKLPYWFPSVSRGISLLRDPHSLTSGPRGQGNGIFTFNLSISSHNSVYDPALAKSLMTQRRSAVQFDPIAWKAASKFFGLSAKHKYDKILGEINAQQKKYLTKDPSLRLILDPTIRNLQNNIPQMLTFIDNEIDLQPWEKFSNSTFISSTIIELDLLSLLRDMLGHACIPAMFGRALLDKYPTLLQDVYAMDKAMVFFLLGLPAVTPLPGVFGAHMVRRRVWGAMDAQQRALDGLAEGKGDEVDYEWGDLGDVSELVLERNKLWRENGFKVKERGDINLLFALTTNAPFLVYWHTLYILSTPSLLATILTEITPHVTITAPERIGNHFSPPTLSISHDGLANGCSLFKSTYLEALRMSLPVEDANIPDGSEAEEESHVSTDPDKFIPDRFLTYTSSATQTGDPSTSVVFAERECLALVAGVLMMWEFEPVGEGGWEIPAKEWKGGAGVCRPQGEGTRVRVRRRRFDWDE